MSLLKTEEKGIIVCYKSLPWVACDQCPLLRDEDSMICNTAPHDKKKALMSYLLGNWKKL
jgi:hypothetical protein